MNIRSSLQQSKVFLLVKTSFLVLLATPSMAFNVEIEDTKYSIPNNAYFVSPNGKSNNSGKSPNSPWPVEKAVKQAPSGSTIVFRGGVYRNVSTGIAKKLILQAHPHEKPWLKGSIEVKGWVADDGKWRHDGWNPPLPVIQEKYIDPKHPMARYTDMVYINGVSLIQVGSKANVGPGRFYVDKANNKLYIGNNPAGQTIEATVLKQAFGMWQNNNKRPSGTIIRGLGFAHYADRALEVGAPNVTLEKNTFVWNGYVGVHIAGSNNTRVGGNAAVVRGNIFSYNGCLGLGGQADGVLLEGNTISHNNIEHCRKTWGAAGVKLIKTSDAVLRNNRVENNYASGIWLDGSSLNAKIVDNTTQNNEAAGIFYELSHKALISGNVVRSNNVGIMIADSSSVQVFNNTLINNRNKAIIVKDSSRVNKTQSDIAKGITWISRNNIIRNNTIN